MKKAAVPYDVNKLGIEQLTELCQSQDPLLPGTFRKFFHIYTWVFSDEPAALGIFEHDLENGQCPVCSDCGVLVLQRYSPVFDISPGNHAKDSITEIGKNMILQVRPLLLCIRPGIMTPIPFAVQILTLVPQEPILCA